MPHSTGKRPAAPRVSARISAVDRSGAITFVNDTITHGTSAISFPHALDRFYNALRNHQDDVTSTLRILQFGDSHTAADMFTGEARHLIQQQFGNGSIGFSYAGHPFAGYRILGSQRSQTSGWTTQGNHFTALGDTRTGLGGLSISASSPGESVTLDAPCTTLELQYLRQPGGGSLRFTDNDQDVAEISTGTADNVATEAGTYSYPCQPGDHHFVFTTTSADPVRLLGLTATQPGVTWESIGINGAEAPLILKWNQDLFTTYLTQASPALIVLAYGTNEAAARWTAEDYATTFAELIDLLHQTAPQASILVLGPADRSLGSRRAYHSFTGTDRIVQAQRQVCSTHDCAFWDWSKRMGGFGSMNRWVYAGWAQPDHTHFTGDGYRNLADALIADLLSGYEAFLKSPTTNLLSSKKD